SLGQRYDLFATVQQDRVGSSDEGVRFRPYKRFKGNIDLARVAGVESERLATECFCASLGVCLFVQCTEVCWVHQQSDTRHLWEQLAQKSDTLCSKHGRLQIDTCHVVTRTIEAGHEAEANRISADGEDYRHCAARRLRGAGRCNIPRRRNCNDTLRD